MIYIIDILRSSTPPTSKPNEFNKVDEKNWKHNFILFLSPLATMYLVSVVAIIQSTGLPKLEDFIPNQVVFGGMILYVLNTALDFFRKYMGGKND